MAEKREPVDPRYWAAVVGRNALAIRKRRGLSRLAVIEQIRARGVAMSPNQLLSLEHNRSNSSKRDSHTVVTVDRLMLLADVLGVSYLELLRDN